MHEFWITRGEKMRDVKQKEGIIHNQEVQDLLDNKVHETTKEFNDLPIIHTGCDTYASIYPEFKHSNMLRTIDEVVEHLISLLPRRKVDYGQWTRYTSYNDRWRILLAWQRLYVELFEQSKNEGLKKCYV